jgi:hypothetical protein
MGVERDQHRIAQLEQIGSARVVPGVSTIIRRMNMTPEPRIIETLSAKRDRRAIEAQAAWKEHEAHALAVNGNMIRLREERLAREARAAALAAEPKTKEPKIKRTRERRKVAATPETGSVRR